MKDRMVDLEMKCQIYLDYNGTCPLDGEVQEAVTNSMKNLWQNPSSRSEGGKACKAAVDEARQQVARMINALPEEITFTSGGTEANNMVIYSAIQACSLFKTQRSSRLAVEESASILDALPHIITTNIEHDSVSALLNFLETHRICQVTRVPVQTSTGAASELEIIGAVRPNTCLITIMLANNETGVLQPVGAVGQLLKDQNAKRAKDLLPTVRLHTDAAQAIGKIPVDMQEDSGIDYLTIVGHKFYAPRIGALFVRKGVPIHPMLFGGGQEKAIRPGTENTPMIVGFGKAAEIVTDKLKSDMIHLKEVRDHLETRLLESFGSGVVVNFAGASRLPNTSSISFNCLSGTATDLITSCKRFIASTGAACHSGKTSPSSVLLACGLSKEAALRTVRFSVGRNTTVAEVDEAIGELCQVIGPQEMKGT